MNINFREAIINDLELLRYWDEQPHVIACDPNDDWKWETELLKKPTWREQIIFEINDEPIGFIQIIDPDLEEDHYWGEIEPHLKAIDIWIGEKKHLNHGYGTEAMSMAINKCFSDPKVKAIVIDPLANNKKAHQFYERLGFKFIEERQFGEDKCFVYRLNREDWNK